jgi:hypothetical protein
VGEVDGEAPLRLEGGRDHPGLVGADLPAAAARLAVKMAVLLARQDVVLLAAVRAVPVAYDPELLEDISVR